MLKESTSLFVRLMCRVSNLQILGLNLGKQRDCYTEKRISTVKVWCDVMPSSLVKVHLPECSILHSHRRENLKSHKIQCTFTQDNTMHRMRTRQVQGLLNYISSHLLLSSQGFNFTPCTASALLIDRCLVSGPYTVYQTLEKSCTENG